MRELTLSPAMLADVVRMADIYNDRAVTRLREAFPGWTGRNYDFAALVIAGFSPQEISVMLGMTLNGVYTLKSKLKRRIADAPAGGRGRTRVSLDPVRVMFRTAAGEGTHDMRTGRSSGKDTGHAVRTLP